MKHNVLIFVAFVTTLLAATCAVAYEGNFQTGFEPSGNQEGYSVTFDGEWKVETFIGEPTRDILFNWDYTNGGKTVSMQFIPYGENEVIEVAVPSQIAKKSKPISVMFKAKLSSLSGGSISFDGGAIQRGNNHNITGSPEWKKLFKQNNNNVPKERAKRIMGSAFELDFGYYPHEITFALADIKLWYAKKQRAGYGQMACQNLTSLYAELSDISTKYKVRHQKMVDLCKTPERVNVKRIKKEVEYLKKMKISAEILSSSQTVELNRAFKDAVRTIHHNLDEIDDTELSFTEIEKQYSAEKEAEQKTEQKIGQKDEEGKAKLNHLKSSFEAGFKPLYRLLKNTSLPPCLAAFRCRERRDVDLSGSVITYERKRKISDSYSSKTQLQWGTFDVCSDLKTSSNASLVFYDYLITGKTVFKDGRESSPIQSQVLDIGEVSIETLGDAVYQAKKQCKK